MIGVPDCMGARIGVVWGPQGTPNPLARLESCLKDTPRHLAWPYGHIHKLFSAVFGGQNSPVLACFGLEMGGLAKTAKRQ